MQTLEVPPLTSNRIEELCKELPFVDFRSACNRMSYEQLYQLYISLSSRITVIQSNIDRKGEEDQVWIRKARSACVLMEEKRRIVAGFMINLRTAAITSLGGNGNHAGSSRINMIRSLVVIITKHIDVSRLDGDELSAYDACREVIGLDTDPLIEFDGISYNPMNKMITDNSRREIAFVSRPFYDADEIGHRLAAVSSLIDLSSQAVNDAENIIIGVPCSGKNSCVHCRASAYLAKAKPIMDQLGGTCPAKSNPESYQIK